ncbi:hypothetical protein TIFTF001_048523 [Ficus carica]|uniref:Uncharacterized protein n=1 Tax=Ficus carica TaxID=3494 RepID=A0AA87YTR3_FICCA|nr:hypothetical protein TIFTF001_048519 [Ficus carica]GMN18724.1 hypothetical protein TIFTF001_048523 [Ficus carica]
MAAEFRAPRDHGSRAESYVVKMPRSGLGPTAIGAATSLRARYELRRRTLTGRSELQRRVLPPRPCLSG